MDFARKQLEKYGWKDGKGLGKREDGISEAIRPKLKRSVTGIGHDPATDFTEHWWKTLYDKAAKNIQVKEKNGKTKKIKIEEKHFEITNSTWKLKRKIKDNVTKNPEYSEFFIKKATLSNGVAKMDDSSSSESNDEENEKKDVFNMTDEELFAACGGRTAHKGARHGLKALGKLARIEEQEKQLLEESRFNGYSKKKLKQNNDHANIDIDINDITKSDKKRKKNKKKYCNRDDTHCDKNPVDCVNNIDILNNDSTEGIECPTKKKKKNKSIKNVNAMDVDSREENYTCDYNKNKRKDKVDINDSDINNINDSMEIDEQYLNETLSKNALIKRKNKRKLK